MSDWTYVKIRSWHVVREAGFGGLTWRTLCGRSAESQPVDTLPFPAGKSCETCLRLALRAADRPVQVAGDIVHFDGPFFGAGQYTFEDDGSTQPVEVIP